MKKIYMVGNTHFDPVWLWRWDEAMSSITATFRSALARMEEYPDFTYSFSAPAVLEWIKNTDEDLFNELRRKSWDDDRAKMLAHVTGSAETRPQEEEKPEYEVPETGCGNSLVDDFMASWRDNIDSEIAKLQVAMEAEICATNKV